MRVLCCAIPHNDKAMLDFMAFFAASPEALKLPLEMLIVFGSAKLLAEAAEWLKMPGIVGALIAGILIGPAVFNWIQPNELLHALSELGVMFLLFRVGLEVKPSELLRVGKTALVVAMLGVVLPLGLGWAILQMAGHSFVESMFMGAAMVATSVGITAQVLADKGVLSHRTARIILAAAVIDDVLGLLVLAVVSSMAEGRVDIPGLVTTTTVSIVFVTAIVKFGAPAMGRFVPRLKRTVRSQEAEFAWAMIFLFLMAVVAVFSGVAGIIGAFLAGMALSESIGRRVHDLAHGATELLVPFFLTGIGLQMNLAVFQNPAVLGLALAILLAAIATKWLGCGLGALSLGWKNSMRIGVGMVPRGEVGMVVAQIGLAKGAVEQDVYSIAVFMAVATTMVAPPLLSWFYKDLSGELTIEEPKFRVG